MRPALPNTKTRKDIIRRKSYRPISLMNIDGQNPQQNLSVLNLAMYKKNHAPQLSGIYPRDARILQYTQINQCDTPY